MPFAPVIEIQNQILGQTVRIIGTPFGLHYRSDRVQGRRAAYGLKIPLSGTELPAKLKGIKLEVEVAGKSFTQDFPPAPEQSYAFTWDGHDVSGRILQEKQLAKIRVGYVYPASFPRPELTRWQDMTKAVGTWDARIQGLGGWSLSVHHSFDRVGQVLYLGNGERRSKLNINKSTNGQGDHSGNGRTRGEVIIPAADGHEVYIFDSAGRHVQTIDTLTGALRYRFDYDAAGRLASIQDRDGNVTRIERNDAAPTAIIAPYGQRTVLSTDTNGYLASITDPAGASVHFSYVSEGLLASFTDPNGNVYRFSYDDQGRLIRSEDPAGGLDELASTRDGNGSLVALITALGRESTFLTERLPTGEERRVNKCCGGAEVVTLIGTDGTRTITYPNGMSATVEEQPDLRFGVNAALLKRLVLKTPGGLAATTMARRLVALSDPRDPLRLATLTDTVEINGRVHTTFFDASHKRIIHNSPAGRQFVTTIDAQGRVLEIETAGLHPVRFTYDERGRLTTVEQGSGAEVRVLVISYDEQSRIASITDPLKRRVGFDYNMAGEITRQTLPDGKEVFYAYDPNGNQTSISPPGRPPHVFKCTKVNLLQEYIPPKIGEDATETSYTYNSEKQLTRIRRPDGAIIDFVYDDVGHLSAVRFPGGEVRYAYDPKTKQLMATTAPDGGAISYKYDGPLLTETTWIGLISGQVSRVYDHDFRLTSLTLNGGQPCGFQYDADGLLTQAGALTLERDPGNGSITGTKLGKVATTQAYTGFGERKRLAASFDVREVFAVEYERDPLGRISKKTETIEGETTVFDYQYDPAGRLSDVSQNGKPTVHYEYDSNGNRLKYQGRLGNFTGTYDAQDRLLTYGDATYNHTANGEWASKTENGQTTTYDYDVLGNLRSVALPDGTEIEYVIDAANRRVGKKVNGKLVQGFLWQDQLKPSAELDGEGKVVSRFIYASGINVPDYMEKAGKTYRIITDHLGSPRLVIDLVSGEVAQRMDYDEFGNVLSDRNPGFQPFGFAGGMYDPQTKLTRFGARDYDPLSAQWTSKDPIRFRGGLNLYSYVRQSPLMYLDPRGLVTMEELMLGLQGVFGPPPTTGAEAGVFILGGADMVVVGGAFTYAGGQLLGHIGAEYTVLAAAEMGGGLLAPAIAAESLAWGGALWGGGVVIAFGGGFMIGEGINYLTGNEGQLGESFYDWGEGMGWWGYQPTPPLPQSGGCLYR